MRKGALLEAVLDGKEGRAEEILRDAEGREMALDEDERPAKSSRMEGMCVECEDQPRRGHCVECADEFCDICFFALHRKGSRASHRLVLADGREVTGGESGRMGLEPEGMSGEPVGRGSLASAEEKVEREAVVAAAVEGGDRGRVLRSELEEYARTGKGSVGREQLAAWFRERAKYIPLRLTYEERRWLRLVEAALDVSEYTDKVDVYQTQKSKMRRIVEQIQDMCGILSGLVVASDYRAGQELISERDFAANAVFFQRAFEIARRYKIMNPERMRTTYGKLVYLLQDSVDPRIAEVLEFKCVRPIRTVHELLAERGKEALLDDPLLVIATREVLAQGRPRAHIDADIRAKNRAVRALVAKYAGAGMSEDDVERAVHSIADNNAFLRFNRDPCDRMLGYLREYFDRNDEGSGARSLAILAGRNGARLTHNHQTQFVYVEQTLLLWREILNDFFKLWYLAEADLLDESTPYVLRDTGQGLNRVQPAPRVGRDVHRILYDVQRRLGSWVGSSVVHLGDRNVPNALNFVDKYAQIQRILCPITIVLERIQAMCDEDPAVARYVHDAFGSPDAARLYILRDFFRHAFNGSGEAQATFASAGSCIDGRSTSVWEWCSKLDRKPFAKLFYLCQFQSFDGTDW